MALNCKAKPLFCISDSQKTNSNTNEINDIGEEFMSLIVRECDNLSKNTHLHQTLNSLPGDAQCKERLENLLKMVGSSSSSDVSVISRHKCPSNNSFCFNSSQEKTAEETVDYEYNNNKKNNKPTLQKEQLCPVGIPCLVNNDSSCISQYSTEILMMQMEEGTIACPFNLSYAKQTMPSSTVSTSNRQSILPSRKSIRSLQIQNSAASVQQECHGKPPRKGYRNSVDYAFLGSQGMLRAEESKLAEINNIGSSRTFCSIDNMNNSQDYSEEVHGTQQQSQQQKYNQQQQGSLSPESKNLNKGLLQGIRQMHFQIPYAERISIKPTESNSNIQQKLVFQVLFEKASLTQTNKEQEKSFERPACGQNERSNGRKQLAQDSQKKSSYCGLKLKIDTEVKDGRALVTFQKQQQREYPMKGVNIGPSKVPNRNNQSIPRNTVSYLKFYPQQQQHQQISSKTSTYNPEKQSKELLRLLRSSSSVNQYANSQKSPKRCVTTTVTGQTTQTPSTLLAETNPVKHLKETNPKLSKHSRSSSTVKSSNSSNFKNQQSQNRDSYCFGNNNYSHQSSSYTVAKDQLLTYQHQCP